MNQGGSLSEAAGLIETFIQTARSDDYEALGISAVDAWATLGRTQAMNEKEEKAMSAFEEGRKLLAQNGRGSASAGELLTVSARLT